MQAHARMGEEGNAGSNGEAEQAASHSGAETRDRGRYITVSLKPGIAQVRTPVIFDLHLALCTTAAAKTWPQSMHEKALIGNQGSNSCHDKSHMVCTAVPYFNGSCP